MEEFDTSTILPPDVASGSVEGTLPTRSIGAPPSDKPDVFDTSSIKSEDETAQDLAREHINASRAGQLDLSYPEQVKANLIAQGGKSYFRRFMEKAMSIPKEVGKAAPKMGDAITEAMEKEDIRQKNMSVWEHLNEAINPIKTIQNTVAPAVSGTVKAIPATVETIGDAAKMLNPVTHITDIVAPGLGQQQQAIENATSDVAARAYHKLGEGVKQVAGTEDNLQSQSAEQIAPLVAGAVVPGGELAGLEKGVASLSENVLRGTQKGAALLRKGVATAAQKPIVQAGIGAAATGALVGQIPGSHLAYELIAAGFGARWGYKGAVDRVIHTLSKSKLGEVVENANAILATKEGQAAYEGIQNSVDTQVTKLNEKIADLSQTLKRDNPKEWEKMMKRHADGTAMHPELKGDAADIRKYQLESNDLTQKSEALRARSKFNRFADDLDKWAIGKGINTGIGAGIGAGFSGATSPPGDTPTMGEGAIIGGVLGGAAPGTAKGMQNLRAERGRAALQERGAFNLPREDPNYPSHRMSMDALSPNQRDYVNTMAGAADAMGKKVVVLSPEELLAKVPKKSDVIRVTPEVEAIPAMPPTEGRTAPNGMIQGDTLYLNRDALQTGVAGHELTHATQEFFGKSLRESDPEAMKQFEQEYAKQLSSTGDFEFKPQAERDAEIGRILLQNTPIENFYGGKTGVDMAKDLLSKLSMKLFGDKTTVDPVLKAPVSKSDTAQMRARMFDLGEIAAKPKSRTQMPEIVPPSDIPEVAPPPRTTDSGSGATSIPPEPQNAPTGLRTEQKGPPTLDPDVVKSLKKKGFSDEQIANIDPASIVQKGVPDIAESAVQSAPAIPAIVDSPAGELSAPQSIPEIPSPQPTKIPEIVKTGEHPDYIAIRTQAETAKREELAGTSRKTKEAEIHRAGIEAMMRQHAETAGPQDVTFRTNRFGRESISGQRLDLSNPAIQELVKESGLDAAGIRKLTDLQDYVGKTVTIDYLHAPEEQAASGLTRKTEQAESTAQERVAQQKATRRLSKSYVPTNITYNIPSKTFEVNGFSPDKFLNNAATLIPWAKAKGLEGWKSINDPALITDFQNGMENYRNGYTLSGKPIEGTDITAVKPNPGYKPHVLAKDKVDLLVAMMGNEGAKIGVRKPSAEKLDKLELAQKNAPFYEPTTGETSKIRKMLGEEAKLLESTSETLRPELIDKVRAESVSDENTLRPSGFKGDRGAFSEKGTPRNDFSAGGFMPSTHPDAIKEAAVKISDDVIYTGSAHPIIMSNASRDGANIKDAIHGFVTNAGEFLDSSAAYKRAEKMGQNPYSSSYKIEGFDRKLESHMFRNSPDNKLSATTEPRTGKPSLEEIGDRPGEFMPAPEKLQKVAEQYGLRYDGDLPEGEPPRLHLFTDLSGKPTTISVKVGATAGELQAKIKESRQRMGGDTMDFMPSVEDQIQKPEFQRWFGESKVRDDSGKPIVVFTGHMNAELYGDKFNPKKATAGGFYATEDPKIASNYSTGKFGGKEYYENGDQYRFKLKNGKWDKKLWQIELTPEQQAKARQFLSDDERGINPEQRWKDNAPYDVDARRALASGGLRDLQSIWKQLESDGYNIAYLKDDPSGTMPITERQVKNTFEELLDHLGIEWQSHDWIQPGVMPVFLSIKNPLDAEKPFPKDLLGELKKTSKYERPKPDQYGIFSSQWTSDYPLKQWVKDIESGNEYWTTHIPKKALPIIKQFGYDGIKEIGRKGSDLPRDQRQINWIAFEPNQIKSAIANRGTFDPTNPSMTFMPQPANKSIPQLSRSTPRIPLVPPQRKREIPELAVP